MDLTRRQQAVYDLLRKLPRGDIGTLRALVWEELNYNRANLSLPGRGAAAAALIADEPLLFATAGEQGAFHIIYTRLRGERLSMGAQRTLVSSLIREHPYALFIFSNENQDRWQFLNVRHDPAAERRRLFRRITITDEDRLHTAAQRIQMLDVDCVGRDLFGLSPLAIQEQHDQAFNVEAVTQAFFEAYKALFAAIQEELARQTGDAVWAHDYALQFLNRLMFLYFVQRRRWLGGDPEFLRTFWTAYQNAHRPADTFFPEWLSVLFFEAFNGRYHGGHRYFPPPIHDALSLAPYLNGGLFQPNRLDGRHAFVVPDALFARAFGFLEGYNFTISEDSPLDQEVAVDPEMIGKVYESLVNVSAEADERGDAGIFYTPRTEIDLMCRLALVDNLANHLGDKYKSLFYEAVFALAPEEKADADRALAAAGLWPAVDGHLCGLTVLDPACGSGSFLVGMLQVLDDLQARAACQVGRSEPSFDRKKRIIGQSLYGVDVMEWACHVAELRLWLALITDAEIDAVAAHTAREPLLPHFSFKIRCGDSLVQEVGGVDMAHRRGSAVISPTLKGKITRHKNEKLRFYNNDRAGEYRSVEEAERAELHLFREILLERRQTIGERLSKIRRACSETTANLAGEQVPVLDRAKRASLEAEAAELQVEFERAGAAVETLRDRTDLPFVWDIAFAEVFADHDGGFDIVVGNPPYVRQEKIADPHDPRQDPPAEARRAYKARLARSVYRAFPRFFGYNAARDSASRALDAKSDLYIYFYFKGLSLLNAKGSFCFITSNSWLDVGYGCDLQEFLLKHSHVKMVLDNQHSRSFTEAEVNTVIALLGAPIEGRAWGLDRTARFAMFLLPFEATVSAVLFQEIEETATRKTTLEYRIHPMVQRRLLEEGCECNRDEQDLDGDEHCARPTKGRLLGDAEYASGKWGARYLRAPDVYWQICEAIRNRLPALGDVGEVRRGPTTGCNEFFYLDKASAKARGIEDRFLRPVIKTPRDYYAIRIPGSECLIFWCQESRTELSGTKALEYIIWGESRGFDQGPSCRGRANWYSLRGPEKPVLLWPSAFFERHIVYECPDGYMADKVFYTISGDLPISVRAYLNSSVVSLYVEVEGYQLNHGGIFTTTEWLSRLPVLVADDPGLSAVYERIASRDILLCSDELRQMDRRALDVRILELLGLPSTILHDALYAAIEGYVAGRIHKARRGVTQRGRVSA